MTTRRYFFKPASETSSAEIAQSVYDVVFRHNFDAPGFALLDLGQDCTPRAIREFMVGLKRELSRLTVSALGKSLHYLSMGRFDQQVTTKFHLDGAPDESVLILGYEPTAIASRLFIADYSACAHANQITPREFLNRFNPMFTAGAELLRNYITELREFDATHYMILLINNSSADAGAGTQGVMHKAEVSSADPAKQRIVNSTMTFLSTSDQCEVVDQPAQLQFITSNVVSPRLV